MDHGIPGGGGFDLMSLISGSMGPALKGYITEQAANLREVVAIIGEEESRLTALLERTEALMHESNTSLVETRGFRDYPALRYFFESATSLRNAIKEIIQRTEFLQAQSSGLPRSRENEYLHLNLNFSGLGSGYSFDRHNDSPEQTLAELATVSQMTEQVLGILSNFIMPYERMVRSIFDYTVNHYRYLQKRLTSSTNGQGTAWRSPWEHEDEHDSAPNFSGVSFLKTPLIDENPLLTDLVFSMFASLPPEHELPGKHKRKKEGKKEYRIDDLDLQRVAFAWLEVANPRYRSNIDDSSHFLSEISDILRAYHSILKKLVEPSKKIIESSRNSPNIRITLDMNMLETSMQDPETILHRLETLDFSSISPVASELEPKDAKEKAVLMARQKVIDYLAQVYLKLSSETFQGSRFELAREAVIKSVDLYRRVKETTEHGRKQTGMKSEGKTGFYTVTTGQLGAVQIIPAERPKVRLNQVVGKSFDLMKAHLAELAEFASMPDLYLSTAPRGIKSNIIAIGPYGCGKTELARAVASDGRFIGCQVDVSDILTAWRGEFEQNVNRLWDGALELHMENGKKIVYLIMDEFDSWFAESNGIYRDGSHTRVQKTIQQKLDGVKDYSGIVVIALTNEPQVIPAAIYRRFRHIDVVGQLDLGERADLLKMFISRGMPLSSGMRNYHWNAWAEKLEDAPGDVVGRVADQVHTIYMQDLTTNLTRPQIRRLNARLHTLAEHEYENKRSILQDYMSVSPQMVSTALEFVLGNPAVHEQIVRARTVYQNADKILRDLSKRRDAATEGYSDHQMGFIKREK